MKNYFEGIGFAKEVPMVILDNTIYAWSKHDLSLKRNSTSEYTVISSNRSDNCIHFELLTGIDLYSVRFDGDPFFFEYVYIQFSCNKQSIVY